MVGWWNEGSARLLRRLLEERGLSPPRLATKLGVSDRTVRNWTTTTLRTVRPTTSNLHDLCAALGISQAEFRAAAAEYERHQNERADPPALSATLIRPKTAQDAIARLITVRRSRSTIAWLGLIALVLVAVVAWIVVRPKAQTIAIPQSLEGIYDSASGGQVSPDGQQIAFRARSARRQRWTLFVYSLRERTTRELPEAEGNYTTFFWHGDSRSIFFITDLDLMRVRVDGGRPERVGNAPEALRGAVNRKGQVILGSRYGLVGINETGHPAPLTRVRPDEVVHSLPVFLPDQERVLFTITKRNHDNTTSRTLAVLSLRDRSVRNLFPIATAVQYVKGQLLYVRDRTLFARPFDTDQLRFTGPERRIAAPVWSDRVTGEVGFSGSESTLVVTPPPRYPPVYHVTTGGGIRATLTEPADIRYVAVAHGRNEIALVGQGERVDDVSLWLYSLDRRERVRLDAIHGQASSPLFSHDDGTLYYAALGSSWAAIYAITLAAGDKTPRLVIDTRDTAAPRDLSPDGRYLLFQRWTAREGNLWYMPVDPPGGARPFIATPNDEGETARFSPDGRTVAFVGKRAGIFSVFVADFPPRDHAEKPVIQGDGWRGRWSADGKRLYFARKNGVYEANPLTRETRLLFNMNREIAILEVARDGGFFIRETVTAHNPTVATLWWPRLVENPLDISASR